MKFKLLAVLAVILLGFGGNRFAEPARRFLSSFFSPADSEPVPTLTVEDQDFTIQVAAQGELTGLDMKTLSAPRILQGALKIDWLVEEGSIIEADQVVVRFDSSEALLALEANQNIVDIYSQNILREGEESRSEVQLLGIDEDIAELELDFSQSQIRRDEDIFSRWEIQESLMSAALATYKKEQLSKQRDVRKVLSVSDLKILDIQRQRAEAEVDIARKTLDSLEMVSPVEGVVLYRRMDLSQLQEGSEVWSGQPLLDVANLQNYQGRLLILENEVVGVEKGQLVRVSMPALSNREFTGEIQRMSAAPRQVSRYDPRKYFICEVLLDVPPDLMGELKPGMKLTGTIDIGQKTDVIVVPRSAVNKEDSEFVVYVEVDGDYVLKRVQILDSDYAFYVVEGLNSGDKVCLRHPFESQKLRLPDFNAPTLSTRGRRFVSY